MHEGQEHFKNIRPSVMAPYSAGKAAGRALQSRLLHCTRQEIAMTTETAAPRGNWNYPTKVRFGAGRVAELPHACKELGMQRPLLVPDPGLAALPMIKDALAANDKAGLPTGLFADVKGNPIGKNVEDGLKAFRAGKHDGV